MEIALDDCVVDVQEDLKEPAKLWAKLYLSWIYRMCVLSKYGNDFTESMMREVEVLMARAETLSGETGSLRNVFPFWFGKIDSVIPNAGTKIEGREVPIEVFAAMPFLVLDSSSPYYEQEQTDMAEFDVAEAFIKAKEKALPTIQRVVELGATTA